MTKNICIYHDNCADGFTAAILIHRYLKGDVTLIPAQYGEPPPNLKSLNTIDNLFIVDFSYPQEILLAMKAEVKQMVVLDHHKTAEAQLADLDFANFDQNKCGAMLTWEFLYGEDTEVQIFIKYIQDRDLWQFKLKDSKEFSAGLRAHPMDVDTWGTFLELEKSHEILIEEGRIVLRYQQRIIGQILDAAAHGKMQKALYKGHLVPIVNTTHLISEIGHALCQVYPLRSCTSTPTTKEFFL